ncbi:DUF3618 domain-containing protein [Actinomyces slackii]|uniref:Protein of uncharacterized function (DUF3618) n=1 Tax=Actinomyces slackii TaxID=52774 RepID=A0A448KBG5_9ACTO|nr:DUF3618 domain-containing protein [Actinomyces slackii]VEG74273.1 Protein of uncharacterised function (DUF3618) [Actinomyces slackii]
MSDSEQMSGSSQDAPATPEQLEERLRAQRQALADSVDELAWRVDPRAQARAAGEELRDQAQAGLSALRGQAEEGLADLRGRADWLRARMGRTVRGVQDGDPQSLKEAAAAIAVGAVATGLVVAGLLRR